MFIAVKDAPNLVKKVVPTRSTILFGVLSSLLDERHWRNACGAKVETHPWPGHGMEVLRLGDASFCVDPDYGALIFEPNSSRRRTGPSFVPMS